MVYCYKNDDKSWNRFFYFSYQIRMNVPINKVRPKRIFRVLSSPKEKLGYLNDSNTILSRMNSTNYDDIFKSYLLCIYTEIIKRTDISIFGISIVHKWYFYHNDVKLMVHQLYIKWVIARLINWAIMHVTVTSMMKLTYIKSICWWEIAWLAFSSGQVIIEYS